MVLLASRRAIGLYVPVRTHIRWLITTVWMEFTGWSGLYHSGKWLKSRLTKSHFSLLLKWLETPHVKAWWDQDVKWTSELIQKKYANYIKGYKLENGVAKTIKAYIICGDSVPIGYIQIYSAYDFARSKPLTGLPSSLAAFDVLIGEESYLKQGLGSQAIEQFLKKHGNIYTHVFADPENTNLAAIRAYEKAGFKKIIEQSDTGELWMICEQY